VLGRLVVSSGAKRSHGAGFTQPFQVTQLLSAPPFLHYDIGTLRALLGTQRTYIVIMRRVPVTIVARKRKDYYTLWLCVCSLSSLAWNGHVPYYTVICGLSGSTIYFHITKQTA